ncbi:unnamed protein product [Coffea canephora]|uniref:Transmembrane protein n=1 Tax=Coffea canephora TaxID=49390 RepID=A0A068TUS3_COFCA|nr:unnamed protein product [Coffea canephora]
MPSNTCSSFILLFCALLLFSPNYVGLSASRALAEEVMRPMGSKSENYIAFETKKNHEDEGGSRVGQGVEACLPKGFRRTSAPSRYTNYQTLDSSLCSTKGSKNKP